VTKDKLGQESSDESVKNIARGQTLIALRRLDPGDKLKEDDKSKVGEDKKSKVDTGKLKGLLIRYLYDAKLIGYDTLDGKNTIVPGVMHLYSANITKVVLEDAWLPGIDLQKTWLNEGNFKNAYLNRAKLLQDSLLYADFTGSDLSGADFTNADLRFAKLKTDSLPSATLTGACYVEGTEAEYFPPDFDPKKVGMVPMPKEDSDPSDPAKFKRCKSVFLGPNP
jgi:hypothetical protein